MDQPLRPSDVVFSDAVRRMQERLGSRREYARAEEKGFMRDQLNDKARAFIAQRDSLYLGTASADGRPYIQHRGGPTGFLRILDDRTLAMADFPGNKQYITFGNLSENDRVHLFLMDYPNRARMKIWGRAEMVEDDPDLLRRVDDPDYAVRPERAVRIHVEAFDFNCPKHIMPRYPEPQVAAAIAKLESRIEELEAELARVTRETAG
jgi:predicted pyridoxine 5'-phosphate oxidase superfamily flavin-nucleotide-binding protein